MASHAHSHAPPRAGHARALGIALALNLGYTIAEAVAGVLTDSLALLADAAHNLSDVAGLGIALLATLLASRPATPQRSFGFQRAEILSALANGVLLVAASIWIFVEAGRRLANPEDVGGGWLIVVAGIGVLVNLLSGGMLWRLHADNLNVRGAVLHLLGDGLASVGVVLAGLLILTTGWLEADPVVSVLIGIAVLVSSWGVLRDAVNILLEEAPRGMDAADLGRRMAAVPGVVEVHDQHVCTITSGFPALSAHVLVARDDDCHARCRELEAMLHRDFGIDHTTLQVDHAPERDRLIGIEKVRPGLRGREHLRRLPRSGERDSGRYRIARSGPAPNERCCRHRRDRRARARSPSAVACLRGWPSCLCRRRLRLRRHRHMARDRAA